MLDLSTWWFFILASAAIVIVPGPTVTVIIANSLQAGTRAGLMNVLGTQVGLLGMMLVLAFGFAAIVEQMSSLFNVIRMVGAVYLVWLGIKLLLANGAVVGGAALSVQPTRNMRTYFWQGLLVILSNPKALFFFGAFIPQFVNPDEPAVPQILLLGLSFMLVGALLDGGYAVLAGKAASKLSRTRSKWLERLSGTCLIGGGGWLLLQRAD